MIVGWNRRRATREQGFVSISRVAGASEIYGLLNHQQEGIQFVGRQHSGRFGSGSKWSCDRKAPGMRAATVRHEKGLPLGSPWLSGKRRSCSYLPWSHLLVATSDAMKIGCGGRQPYRPKVGENAPAA